MSAEPGAVVVDMKRGVEPGFSGKPEDFARDMALLKAGKPPAPATEPVPVVPEPPPAQPDGQPQAAATTVPAPEPAAPTPAAIPEKFMTPDGKLDEGKLAKSTVNAEEALARYRVLETELRKKQADVQRSRLGAPEMPPAAPAGAPIQPASFEAQIEADIQKNGVGPTLARLFAAAKESALMDARRDIDGLLQETELTKRERELQGIAATDPWVLSGEGYEALARIRQERPWVNQSPTPWTEAYRQHLGDQEMKRRLGSLVSTPTPKPVTAPPTPVTAAPRAPAQQPVNMNDPEAIVKAAGGMTPDQEDAFWVSRGLPPIHKKRR